MSTNTTEKSIKEYTVALPNITLNILDAGPKDGELIVFLHGFPEYSRAWEQQLYYFAEQGYRAIAPDQRGYANSDKPSRIKDYTIDKLVQDVFDLVDAIHTLDGQTTGASFHLVGHDWGAAVAWWTAITQPERLTSLSILNVPHPDVFPRYLAKHPSQILSSWYIFFMQLPWLPEKLMSANNFMQMRSALRPLQKDTISKTQMDEYISVWQRSLRTAIHWYRAMRFMPFMEQPKSMQVTLPSLIIWGKQDAFLQHELAALSIKECDNGTLEYWDDASHWLVHEFPERTNQSLHRFIQLHTAVSPVTQ